jgi:hypothetical protein
MFDVSVTHSGTVNVVTTSNHGLPVEHWADRASDTIISVGQQSHPVIAEQANAFKDTIRHVVLHYMKEAVKSDRTTLIASLEKAGQQDIANLLRAK